MTTLKRLLRTLEGFIDSWRRRWKAVQDTMDDRFLYFAYGSNMLTRRLKAKDRAPSATVVGAGHVTGYRLTFDKVSKKDGHASGKCDISKTGRVTDRVYGVVFSILRAEEAALDKKEGYPKHYDKKIVTVSLAAGDQEVMAYIARTPEVGVRPYHWYKAFVVSGAVEHHLPFPYIEWLRTFESQPDGNEQRRADNEALLFAEDGDVRG